MKGAGSATVGGKATHLFLDLYKGRNKYMSEKIFTFARPTYFINMLYGQAKD
jgi:hypothetical protein